MSDTNRQTQLENELLAEILLDEMYNLKDIEAEMKHHEIISSNVNVDDSRKGSGSTRSSGELRGSGGNSQEGEVCGGISVRDKVDGQNTLGISKVKSDK